MFEHPKTATSWDIDELRQLSETPGVFWEAGDLCMHGLKTRDHDGGEAAAKKPTGFLSTSWCILEEVAILCDGTHTHCSLMGGRAAAAAKYTPQMCGAICRGLRRQLKY